jgi:REP element-mobilizing transposase RayT
MSNHYHLLLHVDQDKSMSWSAIEVIERWQKLFKGAVLVDRYQAGEKLSNAEKLALELLVEKWRSRLCDISWFMRCLNEYVARLANKEDRCSGRYWEGRFKSQALLDDKALIACLTYVDLNPIRAKMADSPETSEFTSIAERIAALKSQPTEETQKTGLNQPIQLLPFVGNHRDNMPKGIPYNLADYLELVGWTGRIIRDDKRGHIAQNLPPILKRLQIDPKHWIYMTSHFESRFKGLVGAAYTLKQTCKKLGYQRSPGMSACQQYLT